MVVLSSSMVVSNKLTQSSRALWSSMLCALRPRSRSPVQLEDDCLTSFMVLLRTEQIICGTVFEVRSGKVDKVVTQRSG